MSNKTGPTSGPSKTVTFRRDGKGPLQFTGERIGSAVREFDLDESPDRPAGHYNVAARLYKTAGGKYVFGFEVYNQTDEYYVCRHAETAPTLEELVEKANKLSWRWLDHDILGEVFENTEVADRFIESVDE
jgi:hypothetical protein